MKTPPRPDASSPSPAFAICRARRCTALLLAASVASLAPAQTVTGVGGSPRMPITGVTLYRSGVGSFERQGPIAAGDTVSLRFAQDGINDLLKSMVILDEQQALRGVSFESNEPLTRQLASFGIDLSGNPSLADLLGRLRGSRITVSADDGPISGTILGSETRQQAVGDSEQPIAVPFINVLTDGGIRSVNLTTVGSVQLQDAGLNAELGKALAALAAHTTDRFKSVAISFAGQGSRTVRIAYVGEMPVWKTSYRLVLPSADGAKGSSLLFGWAIVENSTDDDWSDVRLSLVASQPVSFEMNLSQAMHVERPEVPVPMVAGASPRVYGDSAAFEAQRDLRVAAKRRGEGSGGGGGGFPPPTTAAAPRAMAMDAAAGAFGGAVEGGEDLSWKQSAAAQAEGGAVGESFQYTLRNPVSIARQQSAMLPIVSSEVQARRISIFSAADGIDHPMRGIELSNSSGQPLIPGPIAVFDGNAYAGDAQIAFMGAGDKRLLAYAVDLDVACAITNDSSTATVSLRIVDGFIEETQKIRSAVTYAFKNKDAMRGRTLLVESPKSPGWDLVEPKQPASETGQVYRFEIDIPADKTASLTVAQEITTRQRLAATDYDLPTLLAHASSGKASSAVVDAVRKVATMRASIVAVERDLESAAAERQMITSDQERIRQNMGSIEKGTDLYRRYLAKFDEQENRLAELEKTTETLKQRRQQLSEELKRYLSGLDVS